MLPVPANWTGVGPGVLFRKTIELRSIDTSAALPWNYERCPGVGLLFVFKIYFENPVASRCLASPRLASLRLATPRLAPRLSALYVHTRDGIINAGVFSFACFGRNPRLRRCIMHRRRAFRFNEIRLTRRNMTNRSRRLRPARPTKFYAFIAG